MAIDMRNVKVAINEKNNIYKAENEGQKILDNSPEIAYYPLLDRFKSNSRSILLKEYFDIYTESPYSWRSSIIYSFFEDIASTLIFLLDLVLLHMFLL